MTGVPTKPRTINKMHKKRQEKQTWQRSSIMTPLTAILVRKSNYLSSTHRFQMWPPQQGSKWSRVFQTTKPTWTKQNSLRSYYELTYWNRTIWRQFLNYCFTNITQPRTEHCGWLFVWFQQKNFIPDSNAWNKNYYCCLTIKWAAFIPIQFTTGCLS